MAVRSADANCRSLRKELLVRLQQSFELDRTTVMGLRQNWVNEAIQSGPALPGSNAQWQKTLKKGLAKTRKATLYAKNPAPGLPGGLARWDHSKGR